MSHGWEFVPFGSAEFPNDNPALHGGATWACLGLVGPPRPIVRARPRGTPALLGIEAQSPPGGCPPAPAVGERSGDNDEAAGPPDAASMPAAASEAAPAPEPVEAQGAAESPGEAALDEEVRSDAAIVVADDPAGAVPPSGVRGEPERNREIPAGVDVEPEVAEFASGTPDAGAPAAPPAAADRERGDDERDPYTAFVGALSGVAMAAGASRAAAMLTSVLDGSIDLASLPDQMVERLVRGGIADATSRVVANSFVATASAWRSVLRNETGDFSACGPTTLDAWSADLLKALGIGAESGLDVRKELRKRGVAAFGMRIAA